jgi:tetratricopeptide (TPR) repeat protein
VLDADERLQSDSRDELKRLIQRDEIAGVNVWLASQMPEGQSVSVMAARYCRLFRRLPGVEFTGAIHEQVLPSIRRLGGPVVDSEIVVHHLGYARPSPEKLQRNLQLLEQELAKAPNDPFALANLGLTLHGIGRWAESSDALQKALHSSGHTLDRELRAFAWAKIADNCLLLDQPTEAVKAAEASLAIDPNSFLPRYSLALALGRLGEYHQAFEEVQTMLSRSAQSAFHVQVRREVLCETAGSLLLQLGRACEAAQYYEHAIRYSDTPRLRYLRGGALVLAGEYDAAESEYEAAAHQNYPMAKERQMLCRKLAQMREVV